MYDARSELARIIGFTMWWNLGLHCGDYGYYFDYGDYGDYGDCYSFELQDMFLLDFQ